MDERRNQFINRTAKLWGYDLDTTRQLLSIRPIKAIRLNLNRDLNNTISELSTTVPDVFKIDWAPHTYYSESLNKPSGLKLFKNQDIVIQNSSSFCPVLNLDPKKGDKILDLCAAPGLKTSHISDICNNEAEIIANDLSRARYRKMELFFNTYGCNINSINNDGRTLANNPMYAGYFDKILVDAPCSGEANININVDKDFSAWSLKNIKRLQNLQLSLLKTAYKLVKNGGTIVYSTCTINAEENEIVVSKFLKSHNCILQSTIAGDLPTIKVNQSSLNISVENDILNKCTRIIPSKYNEAFFVAKILKIEEDEFSYDK